MTKTVDEKWDSDYETPKSKRGMWDGWSLERLRSAAKTATGKRAKEIDFAIRAKTGWGKVKEGEVVTESRDWDEMSPEARDLVLHADNDSRLYNSSHKPIVANLANKMKRGIYDKDKAKKLWGYHADRAAMSLAKEGGDGNTPWHKMFNTSHRKEAAAHWEEVHRDDLEHEHKRHHNMHEGFDPSFALDDNQEDILSMLQAALEDKPATFAEHFANAIQPKLTDTIEALKDELKTFVFNHISGKSMFEEGVNCRSKMLLSSKAKRKKPADTADFSPVGEFGTEV